MHDACNSPLHATHAVHLCALSYSPPPVSLAPALLYTACDRYMSAICSGVVAPSGPLSSLRGSRRVLHICCQTKRTHAAAAAAHARPPPPDAQQAWEAHRHAAGRVHNAHGRAVHGRQGQVRGLDLPHKARLEPHLGVQRRVVT